MDKKLAVSAFQYGEKAKSELMISSQLITILSGLKDAERVGGKRIVFQCLDSVRVELQFALKSTGMFEFQRATDALNSSVSLVESDEYDQAVIRIGNTISEVTTVAAKAWQDLEKYGFI